MSRVNQTHEFLLPLARAAVSGKLGVAAFQRDYAWSKDDVVSFFKSIMAGWPIGSMMTWRPDIEDISTLSRSRVGPLDLEEKRPYELLLDGQNRLLSMVWAMYGDEDLGPDEDFSRMERETWQSGEVLVARLSDKSFCWMPSESARSADTMPVGDILRSQISDLSGMEKFRLMEDAFKSGGDAAVVWYFDTIPAAIREAKVTVTQLDEMPLEEARSAFLAIAKAGQPISAEEFDRAVNWSPETRQGGPN